MNRVIYKYPIQLTARQTVKLPVDYKLLHLAMQGDQPCMWVLQYPETTLTDIDIVVVGTGHVEVKNSFEYIGTFQTPPYVWHVFRDHNNATIQD